MSLKPFIKRGVGVSLAGITSSLLFLWWLEEKIIDHRVKTTVDEAIKEVVLPPMPDCVTPIYRESPSDTSTSLPEMRLTAPWYVPPDDTV
jgi:hypothetical protein